VDSARNIHVANSGQLMSDPNIAVYGAGSNGCQTPTTVISGTATGLIQPTGLTLDSSLNIYATDFYANSIDVFSAGSTGNVAPIEAIAEPNTGIDFPFGVALDSSGNIYVGNAGSQDNAGGFDSVTVYPAGSNANVAPTGTISAGGTTPDNTLLNVPDAIAVTPNYGIYVANALGGTNGIGSINWYAVGRYGNIAPDIVFSGANTGLYYPIGLALGSNQYVNYLYVLNATGGSDYAGSVTVYRTYSSGDPAPVQEIGGNSAGDQTGFYYPSSIALDSSNNIYVTNDGSAGGGSDSVTIYAAGSNGNVAPMATISGPLTQLNLPSGIAVDSSGNIYVANDGSDGGGVDSITVFSPGSSGNVAPAFTISGALTGLSQPAGIALFPGL
jgi:hypothetical protein